VSEIPVIIASEVPVVIAN